MKIATYFLGCLIGASLFISCQNQEKAEQNTTEASEEIWEADMYEPSELVLVMRQMHADNMAIKEQVKAGVGPKSVPDEYQKLLTATATNPDELDQLYYNMAKIWLNEYQAVVDAEPDKLVDTYNNMVKTCVNCHENYCLGPIPKIEKLYIK
jgi:cytochrome c556